MKIMLNVTTQERKVGYDEPDWQSELSSWKTRRRKQSEETLMRVAEIKVMEEGATDPDERKMYVHDDKYCK